jgi:hypothetical protein
MGTRARIAVKHPSNGTYASIYTHSDGYPSGHGPTLIEHYNTLDKVYALMARGDLSTLDDTPESCVAYRDRGELDIDAHTSESLFSLKELTQDCGGEYLYVFDNGVWYVAEGGIGFFGMPSSAPPAEMKLLADVLKAEQDEPA